MHGLNIKDFLHDHVHLLNFFRINPSDKNKTESVPNAPILVVCYTNHALDQFLEGIAQFHREGLVRVGGRSSVKSLENYNLKKLRRDVDSTRFSKATYWNLKSKINFFLNFWICFNSLNLLEVKKRIFV